MTRKGISPLIAAVLLIAFTMAVAAILTAWVTTFTQTTTSDIGNRSSTQVSCSFAGLTIYDAVWDTGSSVVTVSVSNTGTRDLTGGVSVTAFLSNGSASSAEISSLDTGRVQTASISMSEKPTRVRAASIDCAGIIDEETDINDN